MYPNYASQPFQNPYATGQVAANRLAQMPQMPAMGANPYAQPNMQPNQVQFVNGPESVDAYPLGPNESVILMDRNRPRFYFKQADAAGVASSTAYDFSVANDAPAEEYVTRAEFEEWKAAHESTVQQPKSTGKRTAAPKQDES